MMPPWPDPGTPGPGFIVQMGSICRCMLGPGHAKMKGLVPALSHAAGLAVGVRA